MTPAPIFRPEAVSAHRERAVRGPATRPRPPRLLAAVLVVLVLVCGVFLTVVPVPTVVQGSAVRSGPALWQVTLPPGAPPPPAGASVRIGPPNGRAQAATVLRTGDSPVVVTVTGAAGLPTGAPAPVRIELPGRTAVAALTGLGR